MSLRALVIVPYMLLLFIGLTLPSDGQHGFLNPKSLAFIATLGVIILSQIARGTVKPRQWNLLIFIFAALAFLITWFLIGAAEGQTPLEIQADQFKLFVITLTFPIMTAFFIDSDYLTPNQFYKAVIYSSFTYILVKCTLVTLHLTGIINVWKIIEFTGWRAMNMSITDGLSRLQTSSDVFTPFLVFFVLQSERLEVQLSNRFKYAYLILALASTFFSFSRYLIAIYIISFMLYWLTLNAKKTILNIIAASALLLTAVYIIGPAKVQKVVALRVFSTNTFISDSIRKSQIRAMFHEIDEAPLFGKGLGAYAKGNIRDSKNKYSYEVQWVAFMMQFGIIGITCLILPLLYIGYQIVNAPPSTTRYAFFTLFLLWILSGLTNPFLLSLASGILYACFYILPETLKSDCYKRGSSLTIEAKPK